jgi:hypothetical protein
MKIIPTESTPWTATPRNTRSGRTSHKYLREAELLPGVGYYARLVKYHEGDDVFTAPRHRHEYDQIRYTLEGTQDFGGGLISKEGTVGYFPAGAYYGPERIEGAEIIIIQWGDSWVSREQYNRAVDDLSQKGEFRDGIYRYIDADGKSHSRDSITAVWESVNGKRMTYPRPRYTSAILMDPRAFDWIAQDRVVSAKCLGRFTERDVYVSLVRWDSAGPFELTDERTQLLFTRAGEITVDGNSYGAQTAVWSDFQESVLVEGKKGTEAICFGFPVDHR